MKFLLQLLLFCLLFFLIYVCSQLLTTDDIGQYIKHATNLDSLSMLVLHIAQTFKIIPLTFLLRRYDKNCKSEFSCYVAFIHNVRATFCLKYRWIFPKGTCGTSKSLETLQHHRKEWIKSSNILEKFAT